MNLAFNIEVNEKNTFLTYSLFTSSQGTLLSGEKTEAFRSAPLATITDDAPYTRPELLKIL